MINTALSQRGQAHPKFTLHVTSTNLPVVCACVRESGEGGSMFTLVQVIGHMTTLYSCACALLSSILKHAKPTLPANYEVMEVTKPAWASQYSLKLRGTYYEGFVEDLESLLTKFKITTFDIRRSKYMDGDSADCIHEPSAENQENHTTVL